MMHFSDHTKRGINELCRKNKVRELSLFGSRVRGDHDANSDFDLLVDFRPDADIDLFDYSRLQVDLSELIGAKVDLASKKGLKKYVRDRVLAEARVIYEG